MNAPPPAAPRSWKPAARHLHTLVMVAATLAAVPALALLSPSLEAQAVVLALGVALLGVPHGGIDHLLGRWVLAPRFGRRWPLVFFGAYLGLMGLVVGLWLAFPLTMLAAFLALSIVHFGREDAGPEVPASGWGRQAEILLRGAAPVLVIIAAFPGQVATFFGWMIPTRARAVEQWIDALALPVGLGVGAGLAVVLGRHLVLALARGPGQATAGPASRRRNHLLAAGEVASLGLLFVAVPPLLAFTVYFCFWHSGRHSLGLAALLDPTDPRRGLSRFARLTVPLSAATVLGGLVVWFGVEGVQGATAATVRVVFIGLSALTLPHMLLGFLVDRRIAIEQNRDRIPHLPA